MVKTTAPLFGFAASGKIGDAVVYMQWKGINDARRYLKPANPKTTDQITQRGYMTAAVAAWHTTEYTEADVVAWNLMGQVQNGIMSGFNTVVKLHIATLVASKAWKYLQNGTISAIGANGFKILFHTDATAGKEIGFYIGKSKTSMIYSALDTVAGGECFNVFAGLTASTTYYFKAASLDADEYAYSGIFKQKTTA